MSTSALMAARICSRQIWAIRGICGKIGVSGSDAICWASFAMFTA
jgi:hypothetical protein